MTIEQPSHIYQEQLSSIYHGLALWKPNPEGLYGRVSIGDVGYVNEGAFIRMFNVTLPWDDVSNKTLGDPFHYDPLSSDSSQSAVRTLANPTTTPAECPERTTLTTSMQSHPISESVKSYSTDGTLYP